MQALVAQRHPFISVIQKRVEKLLFNLNFKVNHNRFWCRLHPRLIFTIHCGRFGLSKVYLVYWKYQKAMLNNFLQSKTHRRLFCLHPCQVWEWRCFACMDLQGNWNGNSWQYNGTFRVIFQGILEIISKKETSWLGIRKHNIQKGWRLYYIMKCWRPCSLAIRVESRQGRVRNSFLTNFAFVANVIAFFFSLMVEAFNLTTWWVWKELKTQKLN